MRSSGDCGLAAEILLCISDTVVMQQHGCMKRQCVNYCSTGICILNCAGRQCAKYAILILHGIHSENPLADMRKFVLDGNYSFNMGN